MKVSRVTVVIFLCAAVLGFIYVSYRIPVDRTKGTLQNLVRLFADLEHKGVRFNSNENKSIYLTVIHSGLDQYPYFTTNEDRQTFTDAWGNDLRFYRDQNNHLIPWSSGQNGEFGTSPSGDDITVTSN